MRSPILILCAAALVASLISLPGAGQATSLCRDASIDYKLGRVDRAVDALLAQALRPDGVPARWQASFAELLSLSTLLVTQCDDDADVIAKGCPLCEAPPEVELAAHTAPALLLDARLGGALWRLAHGEPRAEVAR